MFQTANPYEGLGQETGKALIKKAPTEKTRKEFLWGPKKVCVGKPNVSSKRTSSGNLATEVGISGRKVGEGVKDRRTISWRRAGELKVSRPRL